MGGALYSMHDLALPVTLCEAARHCLVHRCPGSICEAANSPVLQVLSSPVFQMSLSLWCVTCPPTSCLVLLTFPRLLHHTITITCVTVTQYALIYAGAQKNIGCAGVTVVIGEYIKLLCCHHLLLLSRST